MRKVIILLPFWPRNQAVWPAPVAARMCLWGPNAVAPRLGQWSGQFCFILLRGFDLRWKRPCRDSLSPHIFETFEWGRHGMIRWVEWSVKTHGVGTSRNVNMRHVSTCRPCGGVMGSSSQFRLMLESDSSLSEARVWASAVWGLLSDCTPIWSLLYSLRTAG